MRDYLDKRAEHMGNISHHQMYLCRTLDELFYLIEIDLVNQNLSDVQNAKATGEQNPFSTGDRRSVRDVLKVRYLAEKYLRPQLYSSVRYSAAVRMIELTDL